jgi:hypothetical protein
MRRLRNIAFAFLVIASVGPFSGSGVKAGDYYFPYCNQISYYPAYVWQWQYSVCSGDTALAIVSDCEDNCQNLETYCDNLCYGNGFGIAYWESGSCGNPSDGTCQCALNQMC